MERILLLLRCLLVAGCDVDAGRLHPLTGEPDSITASSAHDRSQLVQRLPENRDVPLASSELRSTADDKRTLGHRLSLVIGAPRDAAPPPR